MPALPQPETTAELLTALRALARRTPADKAGLAALEGDSLSLRRHVQQSQAFGDLPETVWHFLDDADIRFKDRDYAALQLADLERCLSRMESGDGPEASNEVPGRRPNPRHQQRRDSRSGFPGKDSPSADGGMPQTAIMAKPTNRLRTLVAAALLLASGLAGSFIGRAYGTAPGSTPAWVGPAILIASLALIVTGLLLLPAAVRAFRAGR